MLTLFNIINLALTAYLWIIIIQVTLSWLVVLDVVNTNSPQAQNLMNLIKKATDPVYKPLRRYIPSIGGIDVSPIVVILAISILKEINFKIFYPKPF
jgi:YggT family protein